MGKGRGRMVDGEEAMVDGEWLREEVDEERVEGGSLMAENPALLF